MLEPLKSSPYGSVNTADSGGHTPVSSYIPTGVHDNAALPMGKYYPSNYESRLGAASSSYAKLPSKPGYGMPTRSEPQVPKYRQETSHIRTQSEVKRRLLQYQRDMVAQATIAANAVIANSGEPSRDADGQSSKRAKLAGLKLPNNFQLGGILSQPHKPTSPRLAPVLGSPGPVTPMTLEGNGDSYLTLGRNDISARREGRSDDNRSPAPISV
jgi:hypothetical protein